MKFYLPTFLLFLMSLCIGSLSIMVWLIPEELYTSFSNGLSYWPLFGLLFSALIFAIAWHQNNQIEKFELQEIALQNNHRQALKEVKQTQAREIKRLSTALDSGRLAYWEWDIEKNTTYFSDAWQSMLGEKALEQNLHSLQKRIHPSDQAEVQTQLLKVLSREIVFYENAHRVRHADGHYLWVYDRGQLIESEQGRPQKLSCVRIDISSHKELEAELKLDKVLLENTQESIAIIDEHRRFIRTNPAFHTAFGFSEEEITHLSLKELLDNLQDEPPIDILAEVDQQLHWRGELTLHQVSGEIALACMIDIQKVIHENTPYYTLVYTDITKLKRTQARLTRLANTDQVTQLPNRHAFFEQITRWIDKYTRIHSKFTLMFLDLDNFKTVNDTLGHDYGDQLLKSVSQLLMENLSEGTFMARVGGDEFVILCQNFTQAHQLSVVGEKLNAMLSQPFSIGPHQIQIGSSIGMAIFPEHGNNQETLLKHADIAMYQAKHAGKGQYRIFSVEPNQSLGHLN